MLCNTDDPEWVRTQEIELNVEGLSFKAAQFHLGACRMLINVDNLDAA